MNPSIRWSIVLCLLLLGTGSLLKGQEDVQSFTRENLLREQSVLLKSDQADILREIKQTPEFANINLLPRYVDAKELERIRALHKAGEEAGNPEPILRELDPLLTAYVSKFGIENFRLDFQLLWMLGGVKHMLGDTAAAIRYYELAKLHDRGDIIPDFALAELKAPKRNDWLPIDQYYELLEVRRKVDPLIFPKAVLQRMGSQINSEFPDYAPYLHPTDSILIFTSRRDHSGMDARLYIDPFAPKNEDLYIAERDFITGDWSSAVRFSDTINSEFNEGSACLAPDGVTLYFTRCREDRGFGSCDIYQATYNPALGRWEHFQNLGGAVNSKSWDSQPHISSDGRTLFFVSNRNGGMGGTDLYYSLRDDKGKWTPARNLGPLVNTPGNEVTPYFHKINETLYFSSDGHLTTFGSYDIYKARWLGDRWEFPKNIGPLINTEGNQYYFTINGRGSVIFYANSDNPEEDHVKQDFDLYSFPMPMEARPDAIAKLNGYLVDSVSGYKLRGTVLIIDLEENVEVAPKSINEEGYFEFDLISDRRYRIFVLGDNFLSIRKDMVVSGDTSFTIFTQSFEENKPIIFESLEFGTNSTKLKSDVKPELDYIVRFLQTYPMFKLEVEGHTDAVGRAESNLRLSQDRARAIADYVVRKGELDTARVHATGYGETRPLVPNDTEENRAKNRRVEFKLVLDETYEGDIWLPTEEELFFGPNAKPVRDPEFDDEFDWTPEEQESWEAEQEEEEPLDEGLDLDAELEKEMLQLLQGEPKAKPRKPEAEEETEEEETEEEEDEN
ncbi:MAG: hypothetical protein OHK0039_03950 [Bacteroidia bacterium]